MKKKVLIIGVSGMIGGMLVRYLYEFAGSQAEQIEIIGITRNKNRAASNLGEELAKKIILIEADIVTQIDKICIDSLDAIIHCAAITTSAEMVEHPVEVADSIVFGTRNMLELARKCNVKSVVYLSSMEVYGVVEDFGRPRDENELGHVNLKSPRSCYPLAKRTAEHYCHLFWAEYGVPVKVARLAQTFGKGVRSEDKRVYVQFAKAVKNGQNIVLNTAGKSIGNYCDTEDVVNAIFTILEKGENGAVYNVVNEESTMTIREMAEFVADTFTGGEIGVTVAVDASKGSKYAADTELRMSSEKLRGLGWKPTKSLKEMYEEVIKQV